MRLATQIRDLGQSLLATLTALLSTIINFIPNLIAAIIALVVGWIAGKILERLAVLAADAMQLDKLLLEREGVSEALGGARITRSPTRVAGLVVFWFTFFAFGIVPAADALRLAPASRAIGRIVGFLPAVFLALFAVVAAVYIAGLLRDAVKALAAARIPHTEWLGYVAWLAVVIFGGALALETLGLAVPFVTTLIAIIFGTAGLALAIGFGYGGRDLFGAIAAGRELRLRLAEGDEVTIGQHTGVIERIGLDAVDLATPEGTVSVPNIQFLQQVVVRQPGRGKEKAAA